MPKLSDQQSNFLTRHLNLKVSTKETPGPKEKFAVTSEENDRLAEIAQSDPEKLLTIDLTQGDTKELFSEDYMEKLKDCEIKGEGDPKLKDLMREIVNGVSGPRRLEVMEELSQIVGVGAAKLDVEYDRFLIVQKQQEQFGVKKGDDVPPLNEDQHPEFMASRGQLLFGKVLGDAFGIHEVFASLLSPTGGLVGPGNWLIPGVVKAGHLDSDNPIALHGTVHDAAGYLGTFHDDGPGYNYRDSKLEILGSGSPLSGQLTGISYWVAAAGDEYILREAEDAIVAVEKKLKGARDAVASLIDDMLAAAEKKKQQLIKAAKDAKDAVVKTAKKVKDAVMGAAEDAKDAAIEQAEEVSDAVAKTAQDVTDAAAKVAEDVTDAAAETAQEMQDAVVGAAEDAKEELLEVTDAIGDAFEQFMKSATEQRDTNPKGEVQEDAADKLKAAASFLWR